MSFRKEREGIERTHFEPMNVGGIVTGRKYANSGSREWSTKTRSKDCKGIIMSAASGRDAGLRSKSSDGVSVKNLVGTYNEDPCSTWASAEDTQSW